MTFDPIEAKRLARWTKHELKDFWQGPEVQKTLRENPALYRELHIAGEKAGVIGKSMAPNPAPNVPYRPPTKAYTPSELAARGQCSEAKVRAFFNSKESSDTFTTDRNKYEAMREAGVSYGLFTARETPYVPTKPVEPEWTMRISDELAAESNLPVGTVVNSQQLEQLCQLKVDRARQAQEAADAKTAEARAAEIATLTAKQQAEQVARDRHQADLDRLVELTTPKPINTPEPIALTTARVIAQEKAKAVEVPIGQ